MTSHSDLMHMLMIVPLEELFDKYPVCRDFFANLRIFDIDFSLPMMQALEQIDTEVISEFGLDRHMIHREFCDYFMAFATRNEAAVTTLKSVSIIGGHGKSGEEEDIRFTVSRGETISIVGPTGSGKSCLLADIECLADGDTPTGRRILIDDATPDESTRMELQGRLVAQLSQNMNFVMDLSVADFLKMHAGSRHSLNVAETIDRCFACANNLAGEAFSLSAKLTQLSGGQSRALMIADTAFMSASPIVLIDEIENAGIDRRKAIELLASKDKIVFISTHDPLLALGADKRLIIQNGRITRIMVTSPDEKACLKEIEELDARLFQIRAKLRSGEAITSNLLKCQQAVEL